MATVQPSHQDFTALLSRLNPSEPTGQTSALVRVPPEPPSTLGQQSDELAQLQPSPTSLISRLALWGIPYAGTTPLLTHVTKVTDAQGTDWLLSPCRTSDVYRVPTVVAERVRHVRRLAPNARFVIAEELPKRKARPTYSPPPRRDPILFCQVPIAETGTGLVCCLGVWEDEEEE